ncbi:MAG: hypothetical protein VXZ37_02870 [Verrucomicrobiota bacterium]|nr:hypothetical protein [Verrucomicrobiota bacterium]
MALDFEDQNETEGALSKWPFFLSAFFILGITLLFAYLQYLQDGILGTWQLIACIFASAVASILIFFPLFVEKALFLSFYGKKPQEEELHRKIFFDMKEVKEELDSLAVKIDKVPSVVDQILKNSREGDHAEQELVSSLLHSLQGMESNLTEKLSALEGLVHSPILPEPDPQIEEVRKNLALTQEKLDALSSKFEQLKDSINEIKAALKSSARSSSPPASPNLENPETHEDQPKTSPVAEVMEEKFAEVKEEEAELPDPEDLAKSFIPEIQEEDPPSEEDATDKDVHPDPEDLEESFTPEIQEEDPPDEEDAFNEDVLPDPKDLEGEEVTIGDEHPDQVPTDIETELDLDLPDPQETIRKVDALLAGEKISEKPSPKIENEEKSKKSALTSVIANVMIGIGNKPYLRGEGPGLSWDEGVPMNFIEIGKWAWSPPRKNASLTIQVYRNDEDPDTSGKFEVKPGEKFELTPKF